MIGGADGDGIDVPIFQQAAIVGDDGAIAAAAARRIAHQVLREFRIRAIDIADGDKLHAVLGHGVLHDVYAAFAVQGAIAPAGAIGAGANGGHDDAVIGAGGRLLAPFS